MDNGNKKLKAYVSVKTLDSLVHPALQMYW